MIEPSFWHTHSKRVPNSAKTHLVFDISLSLYCLFQIACSTSTRQEPLGCLKLLLLCTAGRKEPCSWLTHTQDLQLLALLISVAFMCGVNAVKESGRVKHKTCWFCFDTLLLTPPPPQPWFSGTIAWQPWYIMALGWLQRMCCMIAFHSTTLQVKLKLFVILSYNMQLLLLSQSPDSFPLYLWHSS